MQGLATIEVGHPSDVLEQVFGQKWHPTKHTQMFAALEGLLLRHSFGPRDLKRSRHHHIQGGIHGLQAGNRCFQQGHRAHCPLLDELGQRQRIMLSVFLKLHKRILG